MGTVNILCTMDIMGSDSHEENHHHCGHHGPCGHCGHHQARREGGATGTPDTHTHRRQRSTFLLISDLKRIKVGVLFYYNLLIVYSNCVCSILALSTRHVLAFIKYKKGRRCAYKTVFYCSKIPFRVCCLRFLQSVGYELLF